MTNVDRSTFHAGNRIGLLLIHGLGGTPVEMRFVAQGLAREGFTVSCCQLAGHCGTVEELRRSKWQQWYQSVVEAHDRLRSQCDVVVAGGLSMGGLLAAHLAHERPGEVHGLAFFAPTLWLNGWSMPWHSRLLRYARPLPGIRSSILLPEHEPYGIKDERIRAFVVKAMQSGDSTEAGVFCTPLHSFAQFNAMVAKVRRELGRITQPSLVLHPRADDIADIDNAFYLQRRLGGPVEMHVLDDSYHIITLDRQRAIVIERSAEFARRIAAGVARAAAGEPLRMSAAE